MAGVDVAYLLILKGRGERSVGPLSTVPWGYDVVLVGEACVHSCQ